MLFSPVWFLIIRYFYFSLYLAIRVFPLPRLSSSPVSHMLFKYIYSAGILYLLSIGYASRPLLRSRLTLGGRTFPRKPETFDGKDSHLALATYSGILSSTSSICPFGHTSPYYRMLLYHSSILLNEFAISVDSLAPVIFRATSLDQWAITHSLNEWLLLSQHPGCLRKITSFST